jgi:hypothetical protein
MLGTLLVIALLLLLFGVVGGIAISKFLFFVLIIAAVVALFGVLKRPIGLSRSCTWLRGGGTRSLRVRPCAFSPSACNDRPPSTRGGRG